MKRYFCFLLISVFALCSCEQQEELQQDVNDSAEKVIGEQNKDVEEFIRLNERIDSINRLYASIPTISTRARRFKIHLFLMVFCDAQGYYTGKQAWGTTGGILLSVICSIEYAAKGYKSVDFLLNQIRSFSLNPNYNVNYGSALVGEDDQYGVLHNKLVKEFYNDPYVNAGTFLESDLIRKINNRLRIEGYTALSSSEMSEIESIVKSQRKLENRDEYIIEAKERALYDTQEIDLIVNYVDRIVDMESSSTIRSYTIDIQNVVNSSNLTYETKRSLCRSISVAENSFELWEPVAK